MTAVIAAEAAAPANAASPKFCQLVMACITAAAGPVVAPHAALKARFGGLLRAALGRCTSLMAKPVLAKLNRLFPVDGAGQ